ncbi:unnamed protein product [Dovyalis caffra]|uniref:BHLH domain-containing protein n=1 Tax=Dovyalis caffra TaxID=77055 RepID=A0AAV1RKJ8_9ROSI|nr:unnamed protein product [Dovyalis caffra]
MGSELNVRVEEVTENRCLPAEKSKRKVPKRIHKAEREKLKREKLNDLFDELASALELSEPNTGKASILCETTRLLKDLLTQIDSLKKENVALLSESHYVTVEKNELREENSALEDQIGQLQGELETRVAGQPQTDLNVPPPEYQQPSHFPGDSFRLPGVDAAAAALQQTPAVFVVPIHPDHVQGFPMTTSNVRKPHARYPTGADSWASQLLREQQIARKEVQFSGRDSSISITPDVQGSEVQMNCLQMMIRLFIIHCKTWHQKIVQTLIMDNELDEHVKAMNEIRFCFHDDRPSWYCCLL